MFFRRRLSSTEPTVEKGDFGVRIFGYERYLRAKAAKRALLSYLPRPILEQLEGTQTIRFSNSGIALSWARVLNELGYSVDIISWDDRSYTPRHSYDLAVFHGGKNFSSLQKKLTPAPPIITFASGSEWHFANQQEDNRIADFAKCHGVTMPRDRYVFDSEDAACQAAKGIIVLGDPSMRETYAQYPHVFTINNASYPDRHFDTITKDYDEARRHFLFFAGAGNIHKGLDLVIDAFKDLPALQLHIVTVLEPAFLKVFESELQLPNIHLAGEINMRTAEFYDVIDQCAFCILPSCSEGQAGSVVECMNQGLIPIVSKETRLDATGYGTILDDNSIPTIQKTVTRLSQLSAREVEYRARKTRAIAKKEHSPEAFRKQLHELIKTILK